MAEQNMDALTARLAELLAAINRPNPHNFGTAKSVARQDADDKKRDAIVALVPSLLAEITALQAKAEGARGVIEPFANALAEWGDEEEADGSRDIYNHPLSILVVLDHFRKAARWLAEKPGEGL